LNFFVGGGFSSSYLYPSYLYPSYLKPKEGKAMFNAEGKRLLREKDTGPIEEQLRSLTAVNLDAELKVELDKLQECIRLLTENAKNGGLTGSKQFQHCLKLLKAYVDKNNEMQAKVTAHEEGFHLMTRNFFTDVNRLVINVPVQAQHKRTLVMPHEQDSRKKRKMPGPRKPEDKRGKRMRALKPQKVAAKQTRKKKPVLKTRWQEEPYRQPQEQEHPVRVKLERVNLDPTRAFTVPSVDLLSPSSSSIPNATATDTPIKEEEWKAFEPAHPLRPSPFGRGRTAKRGPMVPPTFDPTKMFATPKFEDLDLDLDDGE
jgi:hypothetical protein